MAFYFPAKLQRILTVYRHILRQQNYVSSRPLYSSTRDSFYFYTVFPRDNNAMMKYIRILYRPCFAGEYDQNHCPDNSSCLPCPQRLPSCRGLPNGYNPVPGRFWSKIYIQCYVNRTISVGHCAVGFFEPEKLICTSTVNPGKTFTYLEHIISSAMVM